MRISRFVLYIIALTFASAPSLRADLITRLPTTEKVVALTFDACQGYEPVSFDKLLLEFLLSRKIPFTVFVTGRFAQSNQDQIKRLAALPYVDIENHSWDHPNTMNRFKVENVAHQVERADQTIAALIGRKPQFFRFPAGNFNQAGLRTVEALGYQAVHWRWPSGDPNRRETADRLHARTMSNTVPGDVLIFHINGRGWHTAEAMPRIVDDLAAQGYRFVLLSNYLGTRRRPATTVEQSITMLRKAVEGALLVPLGQSPVGALH